MKYLNYLLILLGSSVVSFYLYKITSLQSNLVISIISMIVMIGIMIYAIMTMVQNDKLSEEILIALDLEDIHKFHLKTLRKNLADRTNKLIEAELSINRINDKLQASIDDISNLERLLDEKDAEIQSLIDSVRDGSIDVIVDGGSIDD